MQLHRDQNVPKGDNVYITLRLDNISNPGNVGGSKLASIVSKTSTILPHQSDYKCAIDFFNLRPDMPVFYAAIVEGSNADINATQYGLSLTSAAGVNYPARIIYVPDALAPTYSNNLPLPPVDNGGQQDFSNSYYAVYTFWSMIEMINTALTTAYTAFNATNPGIHLSAPYYEYDELTGRMQLIFENSYYAHANRATLNVNSQLLGFVEGIRTIYNNANGDPINFTDYSVVMDAGNARPYALPGDAIVTPPLYRSITQEYDVRYLWCNIRSIIFSSTSISSRPELLPVNRNPNLLTSVLLNSMSIASPSVLTLSSTTDLYDGQLVTVSGAAYSVNGVPVPTDAQYNIRNVTQFTAELYNIDGFPANVTAFVSGGYLSHNSLSNYQTFNTPSRSILAFFDIIVGSSGGVDWRQNLYSAPNYRKWIDLEDNGVLNSLNIEAHIQLNNGVLIPMTIPINSTIDLKMVFQKK